MEDIDYRQEKPEAPNIIVCDLGMCDWLELADGTLLVDYNYISELQKKYGG